MAGSILPVFAVAAGVFVLAFDSGGYGLVTRNALAIGVWWAILMTVGLSLWPREEVPRSALLTGGFLVALAALTVLSIFWAVDAEGAFAEFNRVTLYVGVFALIVLATRRSSAEAWSDGLAIGIVAVAVLALFSRLFPNVLSDRSLPELLPSAATRLSYPLGYWNGLAILVALGVPLLLRAAVSAGRPVIRGLAVAPIPIIAAVIYLASSRGGAAVAVIGVLVFVALSARWAALTASLVAGLGSAVAVAVLVARHQIVNGPLDSAAAGSQGRSAALLIALICLLVAFLYWLGSTLVARPVSLRRPLPALVAGAVVLGCVGGAVAAHPAQRFKDFKRPPPGQAKAEHNFVNAHLLSGSGSGRWQFWSAAADEFESRPVLGRGAGSYEAWWARDGTIAFFIKDAHSLYLEAMAELGVVGLVLVVGAFGTGLAVAVRRLRASAGSRRVTVAALLSAFLGYVIGAGIDWLWEVTVVTLVGIVCLALLTGPATAGEDGLAGEREEDVGAGRRSRRSAVKGLMITAGMLLIGSLTIPLVSDLKVRDSQAAVDRGDLAAALSDARAARSVQPWAASPNLQLALVTERLGDLRAAGVWIGRAIDRDDTDWRLWLIAARIETKQGRIGLALRDLDRARALNPRSPLFSTLPQRPGLG